jgi:hypothetical protein
MTSWDSTPAEEQTSNSFSAVKIEKVRGPGPISVDDEGFNLSLFVEADDDEQLDGD